jgi:hypothetical protein
MRPRPSRRRIWLRRGIAIAIVLAAAVLFVVTRPWSNSTDTDPAGQKSAQQKHPNARINQLRSQAELDSQGGATNTAAGSAATVRSQPAAFAALAKSLPGHVGIAYTTPGSSAAIRTLGDLQGGSAWSTIKVVLAARAIEDAGGPGHLSSTQRSEISAALRESDNAAAMAIWGRLVSRYGSPAGAARSVTQVLRQAGDPSTKVSSVGRDGFSPFGQTDWSLQEQARFMASLAGGCLADRATTSYLLGEMSRVAADQWWGLGSAGAPAKFKGGWGPETDGKYLVRQMGVVSAPSGPLVLTIATVPTDGQLASGEAILTRLASWAKADLRPPAAGGC